MPLAGGNTVNYLFNDEKHTSVDCCRKGLRLSRLAGLGKH